MTDNPYSYQSFSARDIVPVTPSDTVDLEVTSRAVRCQVGGDLRVTTLAGNVRNTNIADGEILPIQVKRIHASGTTATEIEALL